MLKEKCREYPALKIMDIVVRDRDTTQDKIAKEIGCSVRSVGSYIRNLKDWHMPVCTKQGGAGGVKLDHEQYNKIFKDKKMDFVELELLREALEKVPEEYKDVMLKAIIILGGKKW